MRFKFTVTALILSAFLTGCSEQPSPPPHTHGHSVASTVHVREVRNTSDDSVLWWYIIYSNSVQNSCPCYIASSPTRSSDMSSLSFSRTASVPSAAGASSGTKVEEEETEEAEVEATEAATETTEAAPEADTATETAAPAEAAPAAATGDSAPAADAGGGGDSGGGGDGGGGSD